jgi:adenosylcobinamide-GDP ribazoletransferase
MNLRRQVDLLLCAVQFLTRLPTPRLARFEPAWTTRSARYFPLVGQLVGAICGLVFFAAAHLWSGLAAAVMALAAGVLVTGGFHEDGLADTVDGLGGGQSTEQRLEIMKDSRIGTYGVLALALSLAAKAAALAGLAPLNGAATLLAAHGCARAAAVISMAATPYAAEGRAGKWKPVPQGVTLGEVSVAVLIALWPLALIPPAAAALGVLAGGVAAAVVAVLAQRLIGGHTGDVLGAEEQAVELGFLLAAAAMLRR